MKLWHWSKEPVTMLRDRSAEQKVDRKPTGLWVSDESRGDDGWRAWCEAERMAWLHDYVYEVVLAPNASILVVDGAASLDRFDREWATEHEWSPGFADHYIDWPAVADAYDGIVISPYVWERRFDGRVSNWYYGWDCASGCIWRPLAIRSVALADSEVAA